MADATARGTSETAGMLIDTPAFAAQPPKRLVVEGPSAVRARVLAAADDERRRMVRDLHDGAQQRLVHMVILLRLAQQALERADDARELIDDALEQAKAATTELRELAHGVPPTVLSRGGLAAAVQLRAERAPVPVEADVTVGRLPAAVEATAYFVVAEALTNVAKHSRAESADVKAWVDDGALHVEVRDDGVGGAHPDAGGLLGLADRVASLQGELRVTSPPGGGTVIAADLPLPISP